jgi:hypothetical protein
MRASCLFSSFIVKPPGKVLSRLRRIAGRAHDCSVERISEKRQILSAAG